MIPPSLASAVIVCVFIGWPTLPAERPPVEQPQPKAKVEVIATPKPKRVSPSRTAAGTATWYRWRQGQAAAGPGLRAALGRGWRGKTVRVVSGGRSVVVTLTDWCACKGNRIIDLDVRSFARLADPSRGVISVRVTEVQH